MSEQQVKKSRKTSLATQVFIGLGLGILVGVFFGEEVAFLKIGGDAFIALLQITVIPYIVVALITSIGRLTLDDAKALGLKAGSVLLALWAIGMVVVLLSPLAFPDWPSATFFSASQIEEAKPVDFLKLYIPSNLFFSLSNAIVPAVVVFSILFGLAVINVKNKEGLLGTLSTIGDALMAITAFTAKVSPYGVFAITASAAGTIDVADLGRLQVYIVVYAVVVCILSLWLIPGLISTLTPVSYRSIFRAFRGPLITAFATGNVLIVLPLLAAESKKLLEEANEQSGQSGQRAESSVDILIPASFPFPNLGVVLALLFVPFGGWYVGAALAAGDYPVLAFAGLASLFGGTVLALPFLFDLLRLPADLFQLFVTVDVIGSRFGTLLAALHIIAIALIGTYALQGKVRLRVVSLLRFGVISIALVAVALIGIRAFYTYGYVAPYTKQQLLTSLQLIRDPQPHTVFREPPENIMNEPGGPHSFERLKKQGILRACYIEDDYPSAFFNDAGELVGFDIEMTHRFARYLDVSIEFMPLQSVREAAKRIPTSYCDVLMSLLPISPSMTDRFAITSPVLTSPVGLIVEDRRREEFRSWEQIRKRSNLRVAIINTPTTINIMSQMTPNATPVIFEEKKEIGRLLAAGANDVDAVGGFAEEDAAWTILYPNFSLVIPTPILRLPVGYAVARGDTDLLLYLDTWLLNAKLDGTVDELYRYWMLGEVKEAQPPRWSIIRDVLGWIE